MCSADFEGSRTMEDKRKYKRFKVDVLEINGKISLAEKVEIIDISLGGVALKSDRRLNFGKEIMLKLVDKANSIDVRGTVVRSELSGMEKRASGNSAMVYRVGMMFKDGQSDKIAQFLDSIEKSNKKEAPRPVDRRRNVRFFIMTPHDKILSFPAQFTVKVISLGGMLIESDLAMTIESIIPMSLSFDTDKSVNFNGRIVSCKKSENKMPETYEVGVEFKNLTGEDEKLIKSLIDYLAGMEGTVAPKR
jgi:c-di-GMP-binding flagellar brake protein YcgR